MQPCQATVVVLLHHIDQLVAHSSPLFLLDLLVVSIHLLELLVLAATLIVEASAFACRRAGEWRLVSLIRRYFDLEHEDLVIGYIYRVDTDLTIKRLTMHFDWQLIRVAIRGIDLLRDFSDGLLALVDLPEPRPREELEDRMTQARSREQCLRHSHVQLAHGRSPGNEDRERHLIVSWEEVHLWHQVDSQPTQMKLEDVLSLYGRLGLPPRHLIRTFICHRGIIVPHGFVASAGPDCVLIGGALVIFLR